MYLYDPGTLRWVGMPRGVTRKDEFLVTSGVTNDKEVLCHTLALAHSHTHKETDLRELLRTGSDLIGLAQNLPFALDWRAVA